MDIQALIKLNITFILYFIKIITIKRLNRTFHCLGCLRQQGDCLIMILYLKMEVPLMTAQIEAYAKRLKLSWIRKHYHEIEAQSNHEYLLKLFENEVQQREERKVNLLLKQAQLPKTGDQPFQWKHIQIPQGIERVMILKRDFNQQNEKIIFYDAVRTGKIYLTAIISINGIHKSGRKLKFFTVASLANKLREANQNGTLPRLMRQIEKLDLL